MFIDRPPPQRVTHTGRLTARRREGMEAVLLTIAGIGRQPRVWLYALAEPGEDPGPDLAAARSYAECQGWTVKGWEVDEDGRGSAPGARRGWRKACAAMSAAFADGVVVINRATVAGSDSQYEGVLEWLETHRTFLALVPPPRSEQ